MSCKVLINLSSSLYVAVIRIGAKVQINSPMHSLLSLYPDHIVDLIQLSCANLCSDETMITQLSQTNELHRITTFGSFSHKYTLE